MSPKYTEEYRLVCQVNKALQQCINFSVQRSDKSFQLLNMRLNVCTIQPYITYQASEHFCLVERATEQDITLIARRLRAYFEQRYADRKAAARSQHTQRRETASENRVL